MSDSIVMPENAWQGNELTSRVKSLHRLITVICWIRIYVLLGETRRRTFAEDEVETHEDKFRVGHDEPLRAVVGL